MTEVQRLEIEYEAADVMVQFLSQQLDEYTVKREQISMRLNRARRLEREELQNATSHHSS